jgi:hypothetical protein
MTEYTLDKYDFKRYLLKQLPDSRQEELIFWKKKIPIPVDLVYSVFERRGVLLNHYIHHIGAAFLFSWIAREEGKEWASLLAAQPNPDNDLTSIKQKFIDYADRSGVRNLLGEIAESLLLENYQTDEHLLALSLSHQGKKYERLFLPPLIKAKIKAVFPELLQFVAVGNGDMFANVVADELKIYRNGFADVFSSIFNKLLEYILNNSSGSTKGYSNASGLRITHLDDNDHNQSTEIIYGSVSDGSIWEPVYTGAVTTFVLNSHHPFSDQLKKAGPEAEKMVSILISAMSEKENEIFRSGDKRLLEIFRQDVSRELRIRAEKNSNF